MIYIAGPLSKGMMRENVRHALKAADDLLNQGFAPLVPQLSHFWDMVSPKGYEEWMRLDFAYIERCDGLLRLPGESAGAEREVDLARRLGLPVFRNVLEVVAHFGGVLPPCQ